jgi:hypothetical protein
MLASQSTNFLRSSARWVLPALLLDLALVTGFTMVGRLIHGYDLSFGGVAHTAWPFVAAALLGWVVSLAWRRPLAILRSAIPVWVVTIGVGMLLRVASGEGAALPFIIVATVFVGAVLLGWRAIARPLVTRAARARELQQSAPSSQSPQTPASLG